jgi:hypothetical protein
MPASKQVDRSRCNLPAHPGWWHLGYDIGLFRWPVWSGLIELETVSSTPEENAEQIF